MSRSKYTGLAVLAAFSVSVGGFAGLAVDFDTSQITSAVQKEYYSYPLDTNTPTWVSGSPDGLPVIYTGLFLDPADPLLITGSAPGVTNGAAISFGSNGGAKLQLNGPWLGSGTSTMPGLDDGRYAQGDECTGVFLFRKSEFQNGLDTGTVAMVSGFDTLSADLVYQPKGILASGSFRWVVQDGGAFYISDVVTNITSTVNVAFTVQDNALSLSWYQYDPVGDGTLATVSTIGAIGAPASPALQDIDVFGFWLQAAVETNTGFRLYPHLGVEGYQATANTGVLPIVGPGECVLDAAVHYQTMEGFGASGAFYQNRLINHNQSSELADLLFADLGLDIFRIRNVYQQSGYVNDVQVFKDTIDLGEAAAGRPLKVMISSWTPPASLKSTGSESGANNATLASDAYGYRYDDFGDWWADSLGYFSSQGIDAEYISIQNEPNWHPDYDGCGFEPTETTNFAGYNLAFEAVWQELDNRYGAAMPKMIGPEPIGINRLDEYIDALIDQDHVYGYAHHLYQSNPAQNPDALNAQMAATQAAYGHKPLFQTEYAYLKGNTNSEIQRKLDLAKLMYNALTIEDLSAYFYWGLYWDSTDEQGLINIPNNPSAAYSINTEYYAFKHYSGFVHADWNRVEVDTGTNALSISAFTSPDRDEMTVIVVNEGAASVNLDLTLKNIAVTAGSIYQSTDVLDCALIGAYTPGSSVLIPAESITTLSLVTQPPIALWDEWIAGYPGVGGNNGLLDHADSDTLDNLTEYAWGGDPADGSDRGHAPVQSQAAGGGTNYIEYVYFEREDAASRGLKSILNVATDLAAADWADGSPYETGSGASGVSGYNAVTNLIPIDAEEQQFIRLQIEFTP